MHHHSIFLHDACPTATLVFPEKPAKPSRVVLALADGPASRFIHALFHSQGFAVRCVQTALEVRRMARKKRTVMTFLADEPLNEETGWLTCQKLLLEQPRHRVVIVGTKPATARDERWAKLSGAVAYLAHGATEAAIVKTLGCITSLNAKELRS